MSRPTFVRDLTKDEQQELARLVRSNRDARLVRRAQMIRLSHQGRTTSQIAELWGVNPLTVLRTIKRFNAEGLGGLADKHRNGRPAKATKRYVALLKEVVQTNPRDLGYPFSSWTLDRLQEHLAKVTAVILHPLYLSRLMGRHGIVYRRPKHVMAHLRNPRDYNEKKAILEFLKKARPNGMPVLTCCTSMNVKFISTRP